jgi:hypothetical protein
MKLKIKLLSIIIILSGLFGACNSDDDENTLEIDPNKELYGKWELTELRMTVAQDLNNDGVYSTNLIDELPCFFSEHTFDPDFTYTSNSMGFKMDFISNTEVDFTCTTESRTSGTWTRVSATEITMFGSSWTLEGNKLISEREVEFPEFSKVVYTKVQ